MLLTILICSVPILVVKIMCINLLGLIFGEGSAPFVVGESVISAFGQVIETAILSVAITYGICNMIGSTKNKH